MNINSKLIVNTLQIICLIGYVCVSLMYRNNVGIMNDRHDLDRNHLHLIVNQIGGSMPEKLGGMNKASKIVRTMQKLDNIESSFMRQASKANRSENQRNDRRAKR